MNPDAALPLLISPLLEAIDGVVHGFTTRHGGVSRPPYDSLNVGLSERGEDDPAAVKTNIQRVASALGFEDLAIVSQVHGTVIVPVHQAHPRAQADGVLVTQPGQAVLVKVADCASVLVARRDGKAVCGVHAGWRGAVAGMGACAVRALGTTDVVAAIGPCIGPCCFEVGQEVVDGAVARAGRAVVRTPLAGKPHVDLPGIIVADLVAAGVPCARIDVLRHCTVCGKEFFSHRRDRGVTGRQGGVIGLQA